MKEFNDLLENYSEGKTLPQEFYTNENIFSEEMKRIYHHQWLLAEGKNIWILNYIMYTVNNSFFKKKSLRRY